MLAANSLIFSDAHWEFCTKKIKVKWLFIPPCCRSAPPLTSAGNGGSEAVIVAQLHWTWWHHHSNWSVSIVSLVLFAKCHQTTKCHCASVQRWIDWWVVPQQYTIMVTSSILEVVTAACHCGGSYFGGVVWFFGFQEKRTFQIPWMHAARHGWDLEKDAPLFMKWAIHTGSAHQSVHAPAARERARWLAIGAAAAALLMFTGGRKWCVKTM